MDTSTADALFPRVRQRVLALFFGQPDRSFFTNEAVALAQSGRGAVQRELADLTAAGLLTLRAQGQQRHYQANRLAPVFPKLRGLVLKTFGLADVLRQALAPLPGQIKVAFVFGSVARNEDTSESDFDVMIVSDKLGYADAFGALEPASISLARPINPTLYTVAEFAKRKSKDNAYVTRVMQQPRVWILGSEEDMLGLAA